MSDKQLLLAAGLQSGGTTLVSWCFLQRRDMDGILDLPFDELLPVPDTAASTMWCKMTVASFRWHDLADYYAWQGYEVKPLLIVRDVRHAYASLQGKVYGRNGTTAEDPPLRLRLTRFLRDWELFREQGWPILRYESLLEQPVETLQACCSDIGLPWDEAMISWPKPAAMLSDPQRGNESFWAARAEGGLLESLRPASATVPSLKRGELAWLEEAFAEYNRINGYPAHIEAHVTDEGGFPEALFSSTGRYDLFSKIDGLYDRIEELKVELENSPLCRGRLLSVLINAFPYPRRTLRALRCRREHLKNMADAKE